MAEDIHLSERAAQVARAMLRAQHDNGDYMWLSAGDLATRTGMSKGTVGQILARLSGDMKWLDFFRELGGGDKLYRFTAAGAQQAQELLDGYAPPPAVPAPDGDDGPAVTLAELEKESPAVAAAVRRALGWK